MFPRKLRSLRCLATIILVVFICGCVVTIIRVNQIRDFRKSSFLEPFFNRRNDQPLDGKHANHEKMNDLRTNLPKINPKFVIPKELIANKSQNLAKMINSIDGKLNRMNLHKNSMNVTVQKISLLRKDGAEDVREWHEIQPNYNVHAFYYPWYGNPEIDGSYIHWNHEYLLHWNKKEAKRWPAGQHQPPDDIGSNFYPELGCYSSSDEKVIDAHMKQMRLAGIGVLVLSWYPPGQADGRGKPTDSLVSKILDAAQAHHLKVAFHSEPYEQRNEKTFANDVKYIMDTYGNHPALFRYQRDNGKPLPLYYVYDSYLTNASDWSRIFRKGAPNSIRGSKYDGIFIALFVEAKHRSDVQRGAFDGFYTYFAASGFTYASKWTTWKTLRQFATQNDLLFIPSIGPGYIDTRVRPWNGINTRLRDHGRYYERAFKAAKNIHPEILSITSFNEWHEGTQIERAVPKRYANFSYKDYRLNDPDYYLRLTRQFAEDM